MEHITKLSKIISEEVPSVDKVELLPYHVLGVSKYEALSIPYKLKGVEPMDKERIKELQTLIDNLLNTNKKSESQIA